MYKIEYLQTALADIKEIATYISKELSNHEAAIKLTEKIIEAANSLSDFPYGRPVYYPIRKLDHEYRTMLIDNYTIFYWIYEEKKRVIIARVIYSKRNLSKIIK